MKLKQAMTRRERHLVDIGRVPRADDMAAGIWISLDGLDDIFDLINDLAFRPFPAPPLLAVNGAKIDLRCSFFVVTIGNPSDRSKRI